MLQGRRVVRAEDIARRFEVSLRTVYRDVSALSEVGVPIVAEAGVGYSLMKGYYLPPIMFTENEAAALGIAGMALSKASDASVEQSMQSALSKVRAALPQSQKDRLERVEQSVKFGWGSGGSSNDGGARLLDVQACVCDSRALRIAYRTGGREEAGVRVVEPLGLIHYLDKWHLIAWCRLRGAYRDFRLDRIEKLEILSERVQRRQDFSLDVYLEQQRTVAAPIRVKALFGPLGVDRAKREWSLGLLDEERHPEGAILTLATGKLEWMLGWLLSFRGNVEVIEPVELRVELANEAKRLWERHSAGLESAQ